MKQQRILVISDAGVDLVQRVRRMPYAGETVTENSMKYYYIPGGKGLTSAVAFSRFGADAVFCTKVGHDSNGRRIIGVLREEGVDTRYVLEDEGVPTNMSSIIVEESGTTRMITYRGASASLRHGEIEESFTCCPDAVYLGMSLSDEAIFEGARLANISKIPLIVDASPARHMFPLERLGNVEIFSLNETEARTYTGINPTTEEYALRAAIKLWSMVNAKYIVLKLGERGSFIFDGHEYHSIPAEEVEAVDTTGAGDVFTAVMTYVYLSTGNIVNAVKYATCAAALAVTKVGSLTSVPTVTEVVNYVRRSRGLDEIPEEGPQEDDF